VEKSQDLPKTVKNQWWESKQLRNIFRQKCQNPPIVQKCWSAQLVPKAVLDTIVQYPKREQKQHLKSSGNRATRVFNLVKTEERTYSKLGQKCHQEYILKHLCQCKLLPCGSKITTHSGGNQHTSGRKIGQRSKQFYWCKLLGIVAISATKTKELYTNPRLSLKRSAGALACPT